MTNKQANPIGPSDLADFLKEDSSFAFEIKVRELFATPRCTYRHGGTYEDPHTGLPRQFDLQVELNFKTTFLPIRFAMAIECKCLSEFAPMLVYRSPRSVYEAGHQLIATTCGDRLETRKSISRLTRLETLFQSSSSDRTGPFPSMCVIDVSPSRSVYRSNGTDQFVGKAIDIVSRDGSGKFKSGDKEVYPKWTQALQSASTLMPLDAGTFYDDKRPTIHWILPILVVPDDRLFVVDFDNFGNQQLGPTSAPSTSYFVGYKQQLCIVEVRESKFGHLEIMTYSALKSFVESIVGLSDPAIFEAFVSQWDCLEQLASRH